MSVPFWRRWVAKECRMVWQVTRFEMAAWETACLRRRWRESSKRW